MALPKLETRFTVPASPAWTLRLSDGDGANVQITIPAGVYYWTSVADGGSVSFVSALQTAFNNGGGAITYFVGLDDNVPAATGVVQIQPSSGTTAITWETLALRDLLGFTGNVAAASSIASPNHVKYLWLPNSARTPDAPDPSGITEPWGHEETDLAFSLAPSGAAAASTFNTRNVGMLAFDNILGLKMWKANRTLVNEDLQTWYRDLMSAGAPPFRYHKDRASDTPTATLVLDESGREFIPRPIGFPGWVGPRSLWSVAWVARQYVYVSP